MAVAIENSRGTGCASGDLHGAVKRWRELGECEGAEINRTVERNREFGFPLHNEDAKEIVKKRVVGVLPCPSSPVAVRDE